MNRAGKILWVVNDDGALCDALRLFLEGEGYRVHTACNGAEAQARWKLDGLPALILLDPTRAADFPMAPPAPIVLLHDPRNAEELLARIGQATADRRPEVLVVEDEPAVGKMLSVALRHYGLEVWLAANGAQAVELYKQHSGTIDIVLLDVRMTGMDGPQTLFALQRLDPQVRAVFMSGNTGRYTGEQLLGFGALRVLSKPFSSMADLAATLRQLATDSPAALG
jgi:CheY-like chemotaxis protein